MQMHVHNQKIILLKSNLDILVLGHPLLRPVLCLGSKPFVGKYVEEKRKCDN